MGCCGSKARKSAAPDPAPLLASAHDTAEAAAAAAAAASVKLQEAVLKAEAKRSSPTNSAEAIGSAVPLAPDGTEVDQNSPASKREEAAAELRQDISAAAGVLQYSGEPLETATARSTEPQPLLVDLQPATAAVPAIPAEPETPAGESVQGGKEAVAPSSAVAAPNEQNADAPAAPAQQQPSKVATSSQVQKRGGGKKKGKGGRR